MSTFHPVNFAASLAFWPDFPIAKESCVSGTITVAVFSFSKRSTPKTLAGLKELAINVFTSSLHL